MPVQSVRYGQPDPVEPVVHDIAPSTAEIFCGPSETDLWEAVRDLREHHLRDLCRSVLG
jgi:hypothetical protein